MVPHDTTAPQRVAGRYAGEESVRGPSGYLQKYMRSLSPQQQVGGCDRPGGAIQVMLS